MTPIEMIHGLRWADIPSEARHQARRCLMDTLGVGAGGLSTDLSAMIRDHAAESFGGPARMMFDGRAASAPGVALAAGMTIDALDGHDGYNPAKGHVGAPLVAGLLGLAQLGDLSGEELLVAVVLGYEIGCRVAVGTAWHRARLSHLGQLGRHNGGDGRRAPAGADAGSNPSRHGDR